MGTALSLFVLMSLSVFVVRVASVALRLTGLDETTAKFQALSAVSGTGFTTRESESIVNYPVRRRIVTLLMIIGNLGLVAVFATLVVSFVHTDGDIGAVVVQLAWLLGVLALLWFAILNKRVEHLMCAYIGKILESTTLLGKRHFRRLLQIGDGYSVCEHPVSDAWIEADGVLDTSGLDELGLTVLAVRAADGEFTNHFASTADLKSSDALVLYGSDSGQETLERRSRECEVNREKATNA